MEVAEFLMEYQRLHNTTKEKNILAGETDSILPLHVMITVYQTLLNSQVYLRLGRKATRAFTVCPPFSDKFLKWKSKPGYILRKSMVADLAQY